MSSEPKGTFEVNFEPIGRRIEVEAGTSLLDAARAAGIQIASLCGGVGLCESCIIRLRDGTLSAPSLEEQSARDEGWLEAGQRLACQASPLSNVIIDIPRQSLTTSQRLQLEAKAVNIPLDPSTRGVALKADLPYGLQTAAAMAILVDNLKHAGVEHASWDAPFFDAGSIRLAELEGEAQVILRGDEIIAVIPAHQHQLGLAIDLGTTKLAVFLLDLETGETLAQTGVMNPHISYGEDVVSRISYANKGESERKELTVVLVESLNNAIAELCESVGCERGAIVEAVVVGNTLMHHSFLGLPLRQLGVAPFVPAVEGSQLVRARDRGLELAAAAYVYLPPNIAGYIGADHTAMLLAIQLDQKTGPTLAVDIGTNTEISLLYNNRILSCSCASGPAFEGAHIRDGMRAAPGAIERVQPDNGGIRYQTVGDEQAVGICGSGILDAIAALRSLGWLDRSGRLNQAATNPAYQHAEGLRLVDASESGHGRDIVITRKDIHEIQLAQGAIRAGIEVLLHEAGVPASELEQVYLAGAFGTYLNISSAMELGLLPELDASRIDQVGNAAGEGARQLLISQRKRLDVEQFVERVEYIELTTHPAFTDLFMQYLYLG